MMRLCLTLQDTPNQSKMKPHSRLSAIASLSKDILCDISFLVKRNIKLSLKANVLVFLSTFTLCKYSEIEAQPVISGDDLPLFEIGTRVRNGNTAYEASLFTPSTPPGGAPGGEQWQMNPAGAPIWNTNGNMYGDIHSFLFTYTMSTGTSAWKIDFNRDGDYDDPEESLTNVAPTLAGNGFQYINVWGQGRLSEFTASLTDLTVNGVNFGSFFSSSQTPFSVLFEDVSGLFNDITVSGNFWFSGDGAFERPHILVRLGTPLTSAVCTIASPTEGACFNVVDTITIDVIASDANGITVVEFYDGITIIGEDSLSPYSFDWHGATPGSHSLTAKAIDSNGSITTSSVVVIEINAPPECSITSPVNGIVFISQDSIVIDALASDSDGTVTVVEFYYNSTKIGEDSLIPYTVIWHDPTPGVYSLTAKAIDDKSGMSLSTPVGIGINAPPMCSILNPAHGDTLFDPQIIDVEVLALDVDDSVSLVEFFLDTIKIGEDSIAPYHNTSLVNTPMGMYTLTAKSTDSYGVTTESLPVAITVRCVREDLDNNGTVNTSDFILFLSAFGINCDSCLQDFNDDGAVNSVDFLHLLAVLGYTCN